VARTLPPPESIRQRENADDAVRARLTGGHPCAGLLRIVPEFHLNKAMRLRGAYLLMHRRFNGIFEPLSLTADQFVLLSLLRERKGCTQRELANYSFADAKTVAVMLRVLLRRRLISRREHQSDGRAYAVSLTTAGRKILDRCARAARELESALASCIDAAGARSLDRVISRMSRRG
jgi:DNA-binding MarR family transcriptional regulator